MSEQQASFARKQSSAFRMRQISAERDLTQRNHYLDIPQDRHFTVEILRTICQFGGQRLVVRGSTADGCSDVAVRQLEPVVKMVGVGLRGESDLVQDGIHEFARGISRERPPSAVGAVGAWSQSKNKDTCFGIAEARHGTRPVVLVEEGATLFAPDLLAVNH